MSRLRWTVPVMGRVKVSCSRPRCWLTWDRNWILAFCNEFLQMRLRSWGTPERVSWCCSPSPDGVTCCVCVLPLLSCSAHPESHGTREEHILHPPASFQFLWLQVVLGMWPHHCSFPVCLISTWCPPCHSSGGHCSCLIFILIIVPGFLVNLEPSCFTVFNLLCSHTLRSDIKVLVFVNILCQLYGSRMIADWDKPRVKSIHLFFDALQRSSSLHCDGPWESSVISTRQ